MRAIGGDRPGYLHRLLQLEESLQRHDLAPRTAAERIAVLAPTWSIETWILFLHEGIEIPEQEKSKNPRVKEHQNALDRLLAKKHGTLKHDASVKVTTAWFEGGSSALLPALTDGHREALALGLE